MAAPPAALLAVQCAAPLLVSKPVLRAAARLVSTEYSSNCSEKLGGRDALRLSAKRILKFNLNCTSSRSEAIHVAETMKNNATKPKSDSHQKRDCRKHALLHFVVRPPYGTATAGDAAYQLTHSAAPARQPSPFA